MALPSERELPRLDQDDLVIEVLDPEQAVVHAEVAAAGFQAPVDVFLGLMTPAVIGRPGVRTYVGNGRRRTRTATRRRRLLQEITLESSMWPHCLRIAGTGTEPRSPFELSATAWIGERDGRAVGWGPATATTSTKGSASEPWNRGNAGSRREFVRLGSRIGSTSPSAKKRS